MKVVNNNLQILGGTPVFPGSRVPIKNLFDYLTTGETIDDFLSDFDSVTKAQVVNVLELAEKLVGGRGT